MSQILIKTLFHIIEHYSNFNNNSRNPQRSAWEQLYITLRRLDCEGNAKEVGHNEGFGRVVNYTNRVLNAIYVMINLRRMHRNKE